MTFPKSEFEYDYAAEVKPTSDAGAKIRAVLESAGGVSAVAARRLAATAPTTTTTSAEETTTTREEDGALFLRLPEKKSTSSKSGDRKRKRESGVSEASAAAADGNAEANNPRRNLVVSLPKTAPARGMVRLHEELLLLQRNLKPNAYETTMRDKAFATLSDLTSELFPGCEAVVFGSAATGLSLPDSDVDVVLQNVPTRAIYTLSAALRSRRMVDYIEVIDKARVPIVKLRFKGIPYQVDVCFDEPGGPRTTAFIQGVLRDFPEVGPLTLAVKMFLAQRDLNNTFRGGMGSYLCFLTVLAYVQRVRRAVLGHAGTVAKPPDGNLGSLLVGYFDFYGNTLNVTDVGIRLREEGGFFRKAQRGWDSDERPFLLSIENPENPALDCGKNSHNMPTIRKAFSHAHKALAAAVVVDVVEAGNAAASHLQPILASILHVS